MQQTRRYKIHGKVQNVFFRDFTQTQAQDLDILGWVRNCQDGTVECVATASVDTHDVFSKRLAQGPAQANVTHIESETVPLQNFTDFIIAPSI